MAVTPYLNQFNKDGGTLYVFPSAGRDLTRTFVSNDYEFKFSHFVCLNLPDLYDGSYAEDSDSDLDNDKGLYLSTFGNVNTDLDKALVANLQNYVMNFETVILNGKGDNDDYDPDVLTSVSEKVFFNWLRKVGGIKFSDDDRVEVYTNITNRTVQYIGNIDVMNTVEVNGDSFEELYINIPSSVGASTNVYFRTGDATDNKNYLDTIYELDSEYIEGRKNIQALLDLDTEGKNAYIGDIGHTIDFRDSSYVDGINNMNYESLDSFEFNAILIYYDLLEKTKTTGVKRTATNLYGILFLGKPKKENNRCYIDRQLKVKETIYGNGNSYALKLNLKVDTGSDVKYTTTSIIDPNTTVSMSLYSKALAQLQKCIDIFYRQKNEIIKLTERVEALENIVTDIDSVNSLKNEINILNSKFDGNSLVDTKTLMDLIESNSNKLNTIMNGGKDLKLQYDTDVIQPGFGITIEKPSKNKVVIGSEHLYAVNEVYDKNKYEINENNKIHTTYLDPHCYIDLQAGDNLAIIYIDDTYTTMSGGIGYQSIFKNNIEININNDFKVGQSIKLYFNCGGGSFGFAEGKGVKIITQNDGAFVIGGAEVEGHNLIEFICVSDTGDINKDFIYLIK